MIRKVFYFFFSLALPFLLSGNESFIPDPPSISSSNYILIDANTNRVLAEMNPDEEIEPASITKIMTGYIVSDQIQDGFITLDDEVLISENCWRKKGSRMFIEESSRVVLLDLIKGMVIQSGNDATCAIAEHVAGSEDNFVDLMMRYSERMGLRNTNFVNASGWDGWTDPNHYSSAKDIAKLSSLLIKDFPDHYSLYKEKGFAHNNIYQPNRNTLLWQDDAIDGIKTGNTETAGFCLVSSGMKDQTRLIAVTLNSNSKKSRITDNRRLLDYGFRYFRTKKLVTEGQNVKEEQVWGGELEKVAIAPIQDFYLTLPLRDFKKIESFVSLEDYLQAPISKNQIVGKMLFKLGEEEVGSVDLVTVKEVKSQGFFGRAWSNIKLLVFRFLMEEE